MKLKQEDQQENTGGIVGCAYMPPWGYIATYGCGGVPYGGINCCKISSNKN